MKSYRLAFMLFSVPLAGQAFGADSTLSANRSPVQGYADITLMSSGVSRGRTINKGPVLQPTLKAIMGGFSAGVTANQPLALKEGEQDQEIDLIADYTHAWDIFALTLSTLRADYPGTDWPQDQEVTLKGSFKVPFNPRLTISRGVEGAPKDYSYYEISSRQEIYAKGGFASSVGAALGYIDRPRDVDGFRHVTLTAAASYEALSASANYVIETDKKVNDLTDQSRFYMTTGATVLF